MSASPPTAADPTATVRRVRRLLHLSDPHLTGSGTDMDGVDARGALHGLLHDLRFLDRLDAVVVSGDVADDGSADGVEVVRAAVAGYAARHGCPHVYATGNHDRREGFASVLGSGHLAADGSDLGKPGPGCAAVSDVDGLRLVTLDSLVPGEAHGELGDEQLDWLRDVLREPAAAGTVLALHHPPVSVPSMPWMREVVLHEPERLGAVLAGSDVRAVLAGHLHHQLAGDLAGVPVWVTPGIVTRIDLTAPSHLVRAVLGAGASVVELPDDGPPTFYAVQARPPQAPVYVVDPSAGWSEVPEPA